MITTVPYEILNKLNIYFVLLNWRVKHGTISIALFILEDMRF